MTKQEIIEQLSYDDAAYGGACTKELREAIIAELQSCQWISVSEQLPEAYTSVLITDGTYVDLGYYHGNNKSGWGCYTEDSHVYVSDWFPCPALPKPDNKS